jgi:hypothetical protein
MKQFLGDSTYVSFDSDIMHDLEARKDRRFTELPRPAWMRAVHGPDQPCSGARSMWVS